MYLDGKLLVSFKKRVREITDLVTWVEAFSYSVYVDLLLQPPI